MEASFPGVAAETDATLAFVARRTATPRATHCIRTAERCCLTRRAGVSLTWGIATRKAVSNRTAWKTIA